MLKTLTPVEPELVRLCRSKTWVAMAERCETHPQEAKPTRLAEEGAGTTALAIAVRCGAPIGAIKALVRSNAHQLAIFHKFSGSILHEALKHKAPYNILRFLLQAVIHHERVHHGHDTDYLSLLGRQDQQRRNVLHNMVVRAMKELEGGEDRDGMWILFRSLVLAYPEAVQAMDADGNTPLVLALLIPGFNGSVHNEKDEAYVFRMVQLMVTTCPSAATIARRVKARQTRWKCQDNEETNSPFTIGDGAPNPLTYAILYGRSENTIRLLLEAHRKVGVNAALTLVSGYHEVPLHLATSMRSPLSVLQDLVEFDENAVRVQDMHCLTPVDWAWIRHVVDWCSSENAAPERVDIVPSLPSTRRYLSSHFAAWHDRTSAGMESGNVDNRMMTLKSLLDRMRLLLPAAARSAMQEQWSLLHSACAVSCPLSVVRLACQHEPSSLDIQDLHAKRLPLHYAAARPGYRATVPVGVSREVRSIVESSPVMEVASKFRHATHVVDANNQLPIHIAIDTAKKSNDDEATVVTELLRLYPDSLERRDGMTKLYPFMQASEGQDASINMTFLLLRRHPTLLSSGMH